MINMGHMSQFIMEWEQSKIMRDSKIFGISFKEIKNLILRILTNLFTIVLFSIAFKNQTKLSPMNPDYPPTFNTSY
jgi:hypothetical protein